MKYYIIAGEASGDLHGSNLIKALMSQDSEAEFRVWGGNKMANTGVSMASHYNELSFMGFVGLLGNIRRVIKKIKFCKEDIQVFKPDAIIFIDFSGFNLRIAKWAKDLPLQRYYYISPQIWASRSGRISTIKKTIDKMFCILPFEKAYYAEHDYDVDYVGHPLMDEISNFQPDPNFRAKYSLDERPIIALLPGSRKQEITNVLNELIKLISHFQEYQFVIAGAPAIEISLYEQIIGEDIKNSSFTIIHGSTYDILNQAKAAIVTSGTATLETALFKVPQIVVYKSSFINYWIAKRIVKVDFISLVNLISGKEVVKELIQGEMTWQNLRRELNAILRSARREDQLLAYDKLIEQMGKPGAALRTAKAIFTLTKKN